MKKVGIITILKTNNYGAELQAYATQAILNKLGFKSEIIDYLFYKNQHHKRTRKSLPVFKFGLKKRFAEWAYPLVMSLNALGSRKQSGIRAYRFDKFHKENTALSTVYRSMDELYAAKLDYDVYMVGSDQVWNPGVYSSLLPYMLTFAPEEKKRIAYASSFGVSQIDKSQEWFYKKYLPQFSAIGVREKNAVALVDKISGCKATWVLDPTLLLTKEDWLKVAKHSYDIPKDYILLYELTPCPYILELAKYFKEKNGMDIVRICKNASVEDRDGDILNIIDAGPAEFIDLFVNAGMVITNSFHGTAFSINFGKDFCTIAPARKHNNSRQKSILELFGLEERLISENTPFEALSIKEINYPNVKKRLDEEREKSLCFLTNAIDD